MSSSSPITKNTACVTIGIPCYNAERWIEACVRSALALDWPEKQIIVVDDGSNDRSRDILRGFGNAIELVFAEHGGSNLARNEILHRASGEWVQYLDADDYLLPEKISRQFAETSNGSEVIYSPVWIENASTGHRVASEINPRYDIYAQWFSWQMPQTGGCLWRKDVLTKAGGWNERQPCCQEHELYLRALKAGVSFSFAPTPNAVYRIWSEETLCRRDPRQVIHVRSGLMDDLRAWMQSQHLWNKLHDDVVGQAFFEMARSLAKYDLAEASEYHATRKRQGLIKASGSAAPQTYKLAYRALGFSGAERLARALR
ncbi:MAG: glycosyltransferase [Chthoniobacteraceae bacterium]